MKVIKTVSTKGKYDSDRTYKILVKFNGTTTDLKEYLWETAYFYRRCRCSHDCCGHVFGDWRKIKRKGQNKFHVFVNYQRNV